MPPARFRFPGLVFNLRVRGIFDPAIACNQMPIVGWARVVWSGNVAIEVLSCVLNWAVERLSEHEQPWKLCNGPTQAYLLSILRLGWTPKGAGAVVTDSGCTMNFRLVLQIVRREVAAAVRRWEWRRLSRALQEPSLAVGGFVEGVQVLLREGPCPSVPLAGGGTFSENGAPPMGLL